MVSHKGKLITKTKLGDLTQTDNVSTKVRMRIAAILGGKRLSFTFSSDHFHNIT